VPIHNAGHELFIRENADVTAAPMILLNRACLPLTNGTNKIAILAASLDLHQSSSAILITLRGGRCCHCVCVFLALSRALVLALTLTLTLALTLALARALTLTLTLIPTLIATLALALALALALIVTLSNLACWLASFPTARWCCRGGVRVGKPSRHREFPRACASELF